MAKYKTSFTARRASPENVPTPVRWDMLSPAGPSMAHHAGCIINDVLYIHGGIDKKFSKYPLKKLYRMDLEGTRLWQEVRAPNCPALSHHTCLVLHNRYMVLIGGWDGRIRTTEVFAYDTQEDQWIFPTTSRFPEGGGLSSHTATLLKNGDIFVYGRDGSTRCHRRHGNAYLLTGNIKAGAFTYVPLELEVESRSGHTADILGSSIYIIGGRSDKTIETHGGMKGGSAPCPFVSKLAAQLDTLKPLAKPPCGRKQHVSLAGSGSVFIHGGETFDGRSRDPVGEMYLITFKPDTQWYKLGDSGRGRAGHMCCAGGDKVVLHGGEGAKGVIHSDSYLLQVP